MYEVTHNLAAVWGIVSFFGWGGEFPLPKNTGTNTGMCIYLHGILSFSQ